MKQEVKDLAGQALYFTPTAGAAWYTQLSVAEWMAIILGIAQLAYLLRKWWREETAFGLWMKRRLKHGDHPPTTPDPGEM